MSLRARMAGLLYVAAVAAAVAGEFVLRRAPSWVAIALPVVCYAAVMLLLYSLLRRIQAGLALLALALGLAGLCLEALRWQPAHINWAMALHGGFCLVTGWLLARSGYVPRAPALAMALAGVVWLLYLLPPLLRRVTPYNTVAGLVAEALPMLWLLAAGIRGT